MFEKNFILRQHFLIDVFCISTLLRLFSSIFLFSNLHLDDSNKKRARINETRDTYASVKMHKYAYTTCDSNSIV